MRVPPRARDFKHRAELNPALTAHVLHQPLDKDIYALTPAELAEVPSMPPSLEASLANLKKDHEFLLKGDVFTEDLIETWIDYKMSNEVSAIRLRPHPYEFALYYDA